MPHGCKDVVSGGQTTIAWQLETIQSTRLASDQSVTLQRPSSRSIAAAGTGDGRRWSIGGPLKRPRHRAGSVHSVWQFRRVIGSVGSWAGPEPPGPGRRGIRVQEADRSVGNRAVMPTDPAGPVPRDLRCPDPATAARAPPHGLVPCRFFLVLAGGLTLGRFPLPPLAAQPTAKARRLVGPPTRWGDGGRNLPWNERTDSGDVETMMYHPSSASGSPSSASSSPPMPRACRARSHSQLPHPPRPRRAPTLAATAP